MAEEEEERAVLERELELQLEEQKDALHSLAQALSSDPSNPELLEVHEELVQSIKDAEEGLLHLKRARLLLEVDAIHCPKKEPADVKVEPLDPTEVKTEPLVDEEYSVGSKCRFRSNDGRWYNGLVVGLEGSRSAKICFLNPTSENMLMCKFFLQQRCRFGSSCRLSHGINIPISSLKKYIPMKWDPSLAGSSIWALSDSKVGLWKEAELESWDEKLNLGHVVFRDDGSSAMLGAENIELSELAVASDEEESYSGSEESDSSDYEDDSSQGLGFVESTALQRGVQTETTLFTKWENHTRGIASRMMANMGYREGMGLGASGQGMVDPIPVKVLPRKQSLDHAVGNQKAEDEDKGKKRSRGGKRKREKKFAAAARAAKEEEESRPDVFTLINNQLAVHGETTNNGAVKRQQSKTNREEKKEDRRALVAYDDEIKELRIRAQKLEEMMQRNRNEKLVYEAAMRKLNETRKAIASAEAAHASASNAVHSKEKEKRWLKF
ncbi:PREDICTED: zinc finger CCCH domain-containing protein 18 [Nicotiana attenuata]|uniref:Zinc finger ccch domain-containing protein 18 n=1 Tax=Nicotiana attenuata TaxID=49451 RepID=A0A314KU40_NICAT|nr:PREDICTED: zinc finger CCCH domain-containing protein 18 [Nicotiana attenuata]OIT32870.1 zinc finger ccch domain-containing protein 18 [Nicotiana attenuata]